MELYKTRLSLHSYKLTIDLKHMIKILSTFFISLLLTAFAQAGNPHNDYGNDHTRSKLPPGLQKKVAHGGELPPGWQKKLSKGAILDTHIYEYGEVQPYGDRYEKVYVEDKIIQVLRGTHEIIHIIDDLRH